MPNKVFKDKIEFYINNTCNFNCDNCNRLNNYYFSGHDKWQDYEDTYRDWSQKIDFGRIAILGGEPTLNPTLIQWIRGLREFWPTSRLSVLSNGTRLEYWNQRGLFQVLAETNTLLDITMHNRARRDDLIAEICSYLQDPEVSVRPLVQPIQWVESYEQVKDPSWPECKTYEDFQSLPDWIQQECRDIHGIDLDTWLRNTGKFIITDRKDSRTRIELSYSEDFVTAPLKYMGNDQFAVYDSDPQAAHDVCLSKTCTHMMRGKMYKCHHVALLPEFAQQYHVVMTQKDRELLASYVPLESHADVPDMQSFVDNLVHAMPQCKLCPSNLTLGPRLESSLAKPKVKKIIPIKQKDN